MKKYNIGLDIGTTSVGWAVVDQEKFNIVRKGNKKLWGVRLFEEASTAESRRAFRSTRRRYDRRRERIKLLQEEFKNEINKVDIDFFKKLKESFYRNDDNKKTLKLSKEDLEKSKDYNKKYPTIYHLRNELIINREKKDIRLVYLAIHHIIKYRGNFLRDGKFNVNNLNISENLEEIFKDFENNTNVEINDLQNIPLEELSKVLLIDSKSDRKQKVKELLSLNFSKTFCDEFSKLICGSSASLAKLFNLDLDGSEDVKISLEEDYEQNLDKVINLLNDNADIVDEIKELYDSIILKNFFKDDDTKCLSSLMMKNYEQHKLDLKNLKRILSFNRKEYNKIFRSTAANKCLYEKYLCNSISFDEFINDVKKSISLSLEYITDQKIIDDYTINFQKRIEQDDFMPRITTVNNGIYPYQLNEDELIQIIENQGKYYPFLLEKTKDNVYKLVKLLEFKIPYYVGPLNNTTSVKGKDNVNSWIIRKQENTKITPYNFNEVVDLEGSAELFINRMISKCSYLLDEPAMPNNSILYCKFKVLNELKQIKVNNEKIPLDIQNKIYRELFLKKSGTITDKLFKKYLYESNEYSMYGLDISIEGYSSDNKFANNMQPYVDFFGDDGFFSGTKYSIENAEELIRWITIFEDKDMLERKIRNSYQNLSEDIIKKLVNKKYKGWGSLSEKLLTTKYYLDKSCNVKKSIMDLMEETSKNFMQIINEPKYNFQKMIDEYNEVDNTKKINYSLVDNLFTSPATKRGIYQALKVVEEIIDYMGYNPENIVIEMARSEEEKTRTVDRKKYIQKLYESCKKDIENYSQLNKELMSFEKIDQKLFLYFIQEGRSLYSREKLDINKLNDYEIDHILPQTLIKDNSIDNKALVLRSENQEKAASLVLPAKFRTPDKIKWWDLLKKRKLISSKKYNNLIRSHYSDSDIEGFINRQLVETRQITKHVANILKNYYESSNVIYLHADLSHNYREKFELFKYRDLNDYHHAHDAYLAAVLGEYKSKYLKNKIDYNRFKQINESILESKNYKEFKYGFFINSLDNKFNLINEQTGEVILENKKLNETIENTMYCNDILVSKKTEIKSGAFYQETKNSHNKLGKNDVPLKDGLDMTKYGSYTEIYPSYLCLVKYGTKQKVIGIPILIEEKSKKNSILKEQYIKRCLNLKETEKIQILIDKIPFQQLLKYQNHMVYITGSSCELVSAVELHLPKDSAKKWKYLLNLIFNGKDIPKDSDGNSILSEEEKNKQLDEILAFLLTQTRKHYPLYEEIANKFEVYLKDNRLDFDNKIKFVKEFFKLLNGHNANLETITNKYFPNRVGRLTTRTITNGVLYYNSVTGIWSYKYEF